MLKTLFKVMEMKTYHCAEIQLLRINYCAHTLTITSNYFSLNATYKALKLGKSIKYSIIK